MAETVLKDIGVYKNRLLAPIQDSEDIKDLLLVGKEYSDEMWYGNGDDDDYGIVYKQIFPYLYMNETQTEVKAYICYEVEIPYAQTATIKEVKVYVWCVCHKSAIKCRKKGYSGNRVDMLSDAVERAFREYEQKNIDEKKARLGIGRMNLNSATPMNSINKEYYGRQLIFTAPDFKVKGG